jgi:hypothetical protein
MNRQVLWTDTPFDATDLHIAYARLSKDDREILDKQIDALNEGVSARARAQHPYKNVMFGKASAMELLAAIGRLTLRLEDGAIQVDGIIFARP